MQKYFVPDYFETFSCKCGACRHPCCIGWKITVSRDEYFKLIGLPCSEELRRRIDVAFRICDVPSPEDFAEIAPNWYGKCPMLDERGLCSLQCECGEENIPQVCRLYPRSIRKHGDHAECFLAASCEGVTELLISDDKPLRFYEKELPLKPSEKLFDSQEAPDEDFLKLRHECVDIIENREYRLTHRLMNLCRMLNGCDYSSTDEPVIDEKLRFTAFCMLTRLLNWFAENSVSIEDYVDEAYKALELEDLTDRELENSYEIFRELEERFDSRFTGSEIMLEKLLANHICVDNFPIELLEDEKSTKHSGIAICSVYAVLRYLLISCTGDDYSMEHVVDIISAAFRLISHTNFGKNCVVLLHRNDFTSDEQIRAIIDL